MTNALARLQIATKIHFFLLRELNHGIDIEKMLINERYARDVLLVCEACRGSELAALAQQFRQIPPPPAAHQRHDRSAHGSGSQPASAVSLPPTTDAASNASAADADLSEFPPTIFGTDAPHPVPPPPEAKRNWLQRLRAR